MWLLAALLMVGASLFAAPVGVEEPIDTIKIKAYYGTISDAKSGKSLPFATIEALGSNIATVSNIDGNFTIKIARDAKISGLKISYIGYKNKNVALSDFEGDRSVSIELEPSPIQLAEVTIRPQDAMQLIMEVLRNIRDNFYRPHFFHHEAFRRQK